MSEHKSNYEGFGWIKVKRYEMDRDKTWEERYLELEAHHVEETTFLTAQVRRLAAEFQAAGDGR